MKVLNKMNVLDNKILNINESLKKNVKKYTLSSSIRVISYYLKDLYQNKDFSFLYKKIHFKSNPSLSFQKSEIQDILFVNENEEIKVYITLNFLGIFGAGSPLPAHYNERVLESCENDKVLHDFLNLFNNNIQKFIYPIWEKQKYYVLYENKLQDKFSKYMLSILGLYANVKDTNKQMDFNKLLPYLGILSMKQKSASTLASIIKFYIDFEEIEIIQCMRMNSKIPSWQYGSLGDENCSLGESFLIGEFVTNRTSKFRILLKNASSKDMLKYSILGNKMDALKDLISFLVNEPLEYDVCLEIKKDKKDDFYLNKEQYLGVNTWIGNHIEDEQLLIAQKG
ncbi:MAG: type VI secretion system baseplate subunit TssG [Campylobacterales bacterium]|nr:type VI secretion system baseplate subunit TssG [Campylobacterales bacterium]NQY53087.1 type VI secretion system baseplate subunit TssG [Campylobacteraceae bacterium]